MSLLEEEIWTHRETLGSTCPGSMRRGSERVAKRGQRGGSSASQDERGLRRNQSCWSELNLTLILDLPASRTLKNKFLLLKPPSQWLFRYEALATNATGVLTLDISKNKNRDKDLGANSLFGSTPREKKWAAGGRRQVYCLRECGPVHGHG